MRNSSRNRRGFTMMETLIVLTVIGLLAAIALPRLDTFKYRSDASAVTIRSLLMQAQREAIVGQHDVIVGVDTTQHRLILGYDKNNDGQVVTAEHIRRQALPEGTTFSRPPANLGTPGLTDFGAIRAEELGSMAGVSGVPSVTFRRDGSVSTTLELYLVSARKKNSDYRAISVVQATGRTEYYRYGGGSWWKSAQ